MANKNRHLWEDHARICSVKLLGKQGPLELTAAKKRVNDMRRVLPATKVPALIQCIFPPTAENDEGRGGVVASVEQQIRADGALLLSTPGSALVIHTRDCPSVIVVNTKTRAVAIGHAGRDSIFMSRDCLKQENGIIHNLVMSVCPTTSDRQAVVAHITGGIRAQYFRHQHCPEKVHPFWVRFGDRAVTKTCNGRDVWRLDLPWVIKHQLSAHGILSEHISDDNLCTWETPWLGSKRATDAGVPDKTQSNWVIVLRR